MSLGKILAMGFAVLIGSPACKAQSVPSITAIVAAAEKANAGISAAQLEAKISETSVAIRKADYLPRVELDAVDSWGFAGSSGPLGVTGLAGSPFRSGFGADVLISGTILDFGRTDALVDSAKHLAEANRENVEVERSELDRDAILLYLECARYRSRRDQWKFVQKEAERIDHEVQRFVLHGQSSVVDKFLARAQLEQAETSVAEYEQRLSVGEKRIEILTRNLIGKIECPQIESISEDSTKIFELRPNPGEIVPILTGASIHEW